MPRRLYIELSNLQNEQEISNFIEHYFFSVPRIENGQRKSTIASVEEIKKYQTKFKNYRQNLSNYWAEVKRIESEENKTGLRRIRLSSFVTNEMVEDINLHLLDCHPEIRIIPWIRQGNASHLLDDLDTTTQIRSERFHRILTQSPYYGNNLLQLQWHCDNKIAICYSEFAEDMLDGQDLIRICKNCGRLFEAKNYRQKYCDFKECSRNRTNKRVNKFNLSRGI